MLELLLSLVIFALILGVLWWIVSILPLPEPFPRILQVVIVVIAVIYLIYFLMGLIGSGPRLPVLR
jgi:multisubunit Na+/H+ antiporter MnhE subunit